MADPVPYCFTNIRRSTTGSEKCCQRRDTSVRCRDGVSNIEYIHERVLECRLCTTMDVRDPDPFQPRTEEDGPIVTVGIHGHLWYSEKFESVHRMCDHGQLEILERLKLGEETIHVASGSVRGP